MVCPHVAGRASSDAVCLDQSESERCDAGAIASGAPSEHWQPGQSQGAVVAQHPCPTGPGGSAPQLLVAASLAQQKGGASLAGDLLAHAQTGRPSVGIANPAAASSAPK